MDPTYVDFTSVAQSGTPAAIQIPVGGGIEVFGSCTSRMESKYWQAAITDPKILAFMPADFSGRVARLPMLKALKPGESTAVVTYTGGANPVSVAYDVTVESGTQQTRTHDRCHRHIVTSKRGTTTPPRPTLQS